MPTDEFLTLPPEKQEKLRDILANLQKPCSCEAYYNYECFRCRRLARQGAGDALLGQVATERVLRHYGLIP